MQRRALPNSTETTSGTGPGRGGKSAGAAATGAAARPRNRAAADSSFDWNARWVVVLATTTIGLAALAAYWNSFNGAFIFDDQIWIAGNQSIRHLWPIGPVLFPARAAAVGGRPLVSLTLALNYWAGGLNVWGYHAVNLAIHILAAWTLFGIVRRTLLFPVFERRFAASATPLAFAAALLWALHPLQTQAVTYVIQRTESLVGLFYFLTLYCVLRGATATRREWIWYVAAVLSSLLGMATKEVMVTAPLVVLLYDRTFLAGSFRKALAERWGLYLALAATWGIVAWMLVETGFHGDTTGFSVKGFTWWSYLLTQPGVLLHYLRLVVWPSGQCVDYAWPAAHSFWQIVPAGLAIVALLGLTIWALVKRPALGFLGAWFFLILAPTSSFVPLKDAAFEHRMYLPLAAVVVLALFAAPAVFRWFFPQSGKTNLELGWTFVAISAVVAWGLGMVTAERNKAYASAITMWEDVIAKSPRNARAHSTYASLLRDPLQIIEQCQLAIDLDPTFEKTNAATYNSMGRALGAQGKIDEALAAYGKALQCDPRQASVHTNIGGLEARRGDNQAALAEFRTAVEIDPSLALARRNLAMILFRLGRQDDAISQCRAILDDDPKNGQIHSDLGTMLLDQGNAKEAFAQLREGVECDPKNPTCHNDFGRALAEQGRLAEAAAQFQTAVDIQPEYADAHENLGVACEHLGRMPEAVHHWREAARYDPTNIKFLLQIAWTLATHPDPRLRNGKESLMWAQQAVKVAGQRRADALKALAGAYAETGQFELAASTAQQALDLVPPQNKALVDDLRAEIKLYQSGLPFRETARNPAP